MRRLSERFDGVDPGSLRVDPAEVDAALELVEPAVRDGLETAIANVRAVAEAQLREPVATELAQGQRIEHRGAGGRAARPSTSRAGGRPTRRPS